MSKIFKTVQAKRPRSNAFNLSHERKFSANMGYLVPILCEEVVPGDKFQLSTEFLMRMAPMASPVMHRVNVYTHFFFVPNRLVWNEWEDFITGGEDGLQAPVMPFIQTEDLNNASLLGPGTLADYLGVQTGVGAHNTGTISALPFRAYYKIIDDYYRDQNFTEAFLPIAGIGSGDVGTANAVQLATIMPRCWERDYFTSCLPNAQRGAEVTIPLGTEAPLVFDNTTGSQVVKQDGTNNPANAGNLSVDGSANMDNAAGIVDLDVSATHYVDLETATAATVNDLRTATRIQRWLERNMRAGSRYIEQILSHFGIMSSDARLQRAEFLGGGKSPVVISEVLQTSQTDESVTPQGNMAGHGISVGKTHGFQKSFEEHGYVIGIMSVMPRTAYAQGVRRHFLKSDKFDYFWPEFAHLGEQEVYLKELFHAGAGTTLTAKFGYQSRYSEYKFIPDSTHGEFNDTLNHWHMGRIFSSAPGLNAAFNNADPTHRIFADTDTENHKLYVQCYHHLKAIRPMPEFGTPML